MITKKKLHWSMNRFTEISQVNRPVRANLNNRIRAFFIQKKKHATKQQFFERYSFIFMCGIPIWRQSISFFFSKSISFDHLFCSFEFGHHSFLFISISEDSNFWYSWSHAIYFRVNNSLLFYATLLQMPSKWYAHKEASYAHSNYYSSK